MGLFAFAALGLTMLLNVVNQSVSPASQDVYAAMLADRRCSGAGLRGTIPMIRRELANPTEAVWAQAPEKPLAERVSDLVPGVNSSLLVEFASMRREAVMNDDVATALRATTIAGSVVDELSSQYTDPFEFWDALFRINPSTSALVELSPVAFSEQATEALAYCGYTLSPVGGEGSLVWLRRTEAGTWVAVAWHRVWIS